MRWNPIEKNYEMADSSREIYESLNEGIYVEIDLP